ncbi:sialate O-acetylesterase [Pseudovibrio sp. Tun.PSC04-5.I4]|uniref:sialate O-acetylesterase n=1 Tax=Pseudovibrio sp. Tun.PSC04-5.I4 TaxID=1798213 RepID=UPI00088BA60B|nr:sialate O-acetylesterase [Pseudovibrio sp. Tun.PSC04-5.I4]SDR20555.1 hypothetical protein SAMN04515695_3393 [Pseudovibrio sp. Tun.PSC04-5.I4]
MNIWKRTHKLIRVCFYLVGLTIVAQMPAGATTVGFDRCEAVVTWMKGAWQSNAFYAQNGVDGSDASIRKYLSEVEGWCPIQSKKYLFVLAGQSNMFGGSGEYVGAEDWRNNVKSNWTVGGVTPNQKAIETSFDLEIWKQPRNVVNRIYYWHEDPNGQGSFKKVSFHDPLTSSKMQMMVPVNYNLHGPTLGIYFAAQFLITHNDPKAEVYLVGKGFPATGFNQVTKGQTWSSERAAPHKLQDYLVNHSKKAIDALPGGVVAGLLWLQGENDYAMDGVDQKSPGAIDVIAVQYAQNLHEMVLRFRTEVPYAHGARFLVATLIPQHYADPDGAVPSFTNAPDKAHRTLIPNYDPKKTTGVYHSFLIDTFYMKNKPEFQRTLERPSVIKTHYSAFALRKIGKCFAQVALGKDCTKIMSDAVLP